MKGHLFSRATLLAAPRTAARQTFLSFTISWNLRKLMSIESVRPSNHFIFCLPLLLLPSIFPSIGVFSNHLARHIRWPKYWSVSFSVRRVTLERGYLGIKTWVVSPAGKGSGRGDLLLTATGRLTLHEFKLLLLGDRDGVHM